MSCLFNSLSRFVEDDAFTIRQKICDYLATNPTLFGNVSAASAMEWDQQGNDYVHQMRSPSTWGGGIEIKAFCNLYGKRVVVQNIRDRDGASIEFEPEGGAIVEEGEAIVITWSGGHYEPTRVPPTIAGGVPASEAIPNPPRVHNSRFRIRFR